METAVSLVVGVAIGIISGLIGLGGAIFLIPDPGLWVRHGSAPGAGNVGRHAAAAHRSIGFLEVLQRRQRRPEDRGFDGRWILCRRLLWWILGTGYPHLVAASRLCGLPGGAGG